jgi:hypothetical protein
MIKLKFISDFGKEGWQGMGVQIVINNDENHTMEDVQKKLDNALEAIRSQVLENLRLAKDMYSPCSEKSPLENLEASEKA